MQIRPKKMATYQYANLTVIEQGELQGSERDVFEGALIVKVPPSAADIVDHQKIKDAIHQQLQLNLSVQDISRFGAEYFIKTHSPQTTALMLNKAFLKVESHTLTLIPQNPYYNGIIVPRETQTTNFSLTNTGRILPRERLTILISGIPPHLCCDFTIHRLLNGICTVEAISFRPSTLSYSVHVHGLQTLIPDIAHIALSRTTSHGDLLNIWPIWYDTYTEEMLHQLPTPTHDHTSSLHGGIHFQIHKCSKKNSTPRERKKGRETLFFLTIFYLTNCRRHGSGHRAPAWGIYLFRYKNTLWKHRIHKQQYSIN